MKSIYTHTFRLYVILAVASVFSAWLIFAQEAQSLEQRVGHWDIAAMKEAGSQGRTNLIPNLEKAATAPGAPDEPTCIWSKAALAKLGVRKYLDETISELTTTNSALFEENWKFHGAAISKEMRLRWASYDTQEIAFNKLAYINNSSTIKFIAPYLYKTEHGLPQSHVILPPPSGLAIVTLRQMVKEPPDAGKELNSDNYKEIVSLWQQWWEQNKDKYP